MTPDDAPQSRDAILKQLQPKLPQYELLSVIAQGGQGLVLKALQIATGRLVAIKLTRDGPLSTPEQSARFHREVRVMTLLDHPNIVTVFDSGVIEGHEYYVMQFVEGVPIDMFALLDCPNVDSVLTLFLRVVDAVSHAHQRGVIHRDLKPANILVDSDGKPHILDFGLAKEFGEAAGSEDRGLTVSFDGPVLGTLHYLSPEQARGVNLHLDVRSDIYSLAVILYQLIANSFPYEVVGAPVDVQRNIIERDPVPLSKAMLGAASAVSRQMAVPEDLSRVIMMALSKEPSRRYQSAAAFADDLRRVLAGQPVHARSDSLAYLLTKALRRYRIPIAAVVAFIVVTLGFGVFSLVMWQRAETTAEIALTGLQMAGYARMGTAERDAGQLENAIVLYEYAINAGDRITIPDLVIARALVDSHLLIAPILATKESSRQKAREHLAEALAIIRRGIANDPSERLYKSLLSRYYFTLGKIHYENRQWSEALAAYIEEESLLKTIEDQYDDLIRYKHDVAQSQLNQARCLRRLDRVTEGIEILSRAERALGECALATPESTYYQLELARAKGHMGVLHMVAPDFDQRGKAESFLEECASMLSTLERNPGIGRQRYEVLEMLDDVDENLIRFHRRRNRELAQRESNGIVSLKPSETAQ